ncbi:fibronectin type III domain-containing protein [uncultured Dokdonia sp.]|mgnify:CR=1 FL=1|uniref:fibronectin type III domain-containing protein n=1 Tax=uncultured Dokdonia sp. TaxID=575653 RepID=UPI0030EF5ED5|tara:strand:- start:37646 stop:43414 length:5769 start_codon:yes stop_codon:yes gene_type:complete
MKQYLLQLFFLLFAIQVVIAQQFPVQVIPQTIPPRPVVLSDYANASSVNDKVRVQLILNDLTELNREVRLKLFIEGQGINAQSNDVVVGATPIFLEGGVATTLGTAQLAPYFDLQNLQGISPGVYGNSLPEGSYSFCFEVYDLFTGNVVSAKTCTNFVLFDNDPPLLNLPLNAAGIQEMNPLNIVFQWTPRHINVSNVQYELIVSEIWDLNIDPQAAFLSSPPIFQTTTTQTTFIYDGLQPSLIPGKRYGWRVRAFAAAGAEEIGVFTNNGFSEIFYFDYQTQCDEPLFPDVEELTNRSAKLIWQGNFDHLDYTVKYREKDAESEWYDLTTPQDYIEIDNLEPETTYEYKIQGNCMFGSYGETFIQEFTTLSDEASSYQGCAIEPEPILLENQERLTELFLYDNFTAGKFKVRVLEVENSTSPFKGKGYVTIPWLGFITIAAEFENIELNTDKELISGAVVTTYDPDWGNVLNTDGVFDDVFGNNGDVIQYDASDMVISDVQVSADGAITLIDNEGNSVPIVVGTPVIITDSTDNQWLVTNDGEVVELGPAAEGGVVTSENTNGVSSSGSVTAISSQDVVVTFTDSGFYAFDPLPAGASSSLASEYNTISQASGGTYDVPYKAISDISEHTTDFLEGNVTFANGKTKSDLIFKTTEGTAIDTTWSGNTVSLSLTKQFEFGKTAILATVKPADSTGNYDIAGTADLWNMSAKTVNVTVVPINGSSTGTASQIQTELNTIYEKVGISFNVDLKNNFEVPANEWDIGPTIGSLDVGDSGVFSNYSAEENAIKNYYKDNHTIEDDEYYMFVFNNIPIVNEDPSKNTQGFMPLKRQYGFVFNNSITTMAHELGHGVFGLEHYTEDGTDNFLMHEENASGTLLPHMDWQTIHAAGLQLYLFQGDSDGENNNDLIYAHIKAKISELSSSLNSDIISIVHCESCQEDAPDEPEFLPMTQQTIDGLYVPDFNNFSGLSLIYGEKIFKNGSACVTLYYSKNPEESLNVNLSQITGDFLGPDSETDKLWVFDDEENKYDCTRELGPWSSIICEFTNWEITDSYVTDLFNHINNCSPPFIDIIKQQLNQSKLRHNNYAKAMESLLGNESSPENMIFDLTAGINLTTQPEVFREKVNELINSLGVLPYNEAIYFSITDGETSIQDLESFYENGNQLNDELIFESLNITHIELNLGINGNIIVKNQPEINALVSRIEHFNFRYNTIFSDSEILNENTYDEIARRVAAKLMRSSTSGGLARQISEEDFTLIFDNYFGSLRLESTKDIIKEYLESEYPEELRSREDSVNGEDDIVFLIENILKNGTDDEALDLLNFIFSQNILSKLVDQFSGVDLWIADGNYDKLAGAILKLWKKANPDIVINQNFIEGLHNNNKVFPVGAYGLFASDQDNCTPHYLSPDFYQFEIEVLMPSNREALEIYPPNGSSYTTYICTTDQITVTIDNYLEPVGLYFTSPIMIDGQEHVKGEIIVVPAFMLFQIRDEQFNQRIANFAELLVDVGLTFTGVGNLTKLKHLSTAQKALAIYEVTSSTADIASRVSTEILISEGNLSISKANNIKTVTGTLAGMAGLAEISYKGRQLFLNYIDSSQDFIDASVDFNNVKSSLDPDLPTTQTLNSLFNAVDHVNSIRTSLITRLANSHPEVSSWLNDFPSISSSSLNKLDNWDDTLISKFDIALATNSNLGNEIINSQLLLQHFEGVHTQWWYKYGLLREHYVNSTNFLPDNFKNLVEDLEDISGNKISTIINSTAQSPTVHLGQLIEDDLIINIGNALENGGDFASFPSSLRTKLQSIYNEGYNVMITQARVDLNPHFSGNPQPDLLFFKYENGAIDYNSAIYIDSKLHVTTSFSGPQRDLKFLSGTDAEVRINGFAQDKNPEIFSPAGIDLDLDVDFFNRAIRILETSKTGTKFENDAVQFLHKQ